MWVTPWRIWSLGKFSSMYFSRVYNIYITLPSRELKALDKYYPLILSTFMTSKWQELVLPFSSGRKLWEWKFKIPVRGMKVLWLWSLSKRSPESWKFINPLSLSFSLSLSLYIYIYMKAMATHSSTLAWKIPWTEEPGRLQSMGLWSVGHDWATSLSLFSFMHWRRKWQPTPVFLPGESQGRRSLVGCHLWGCTESDMTKVT